MNRVIELRTQVTSLRKRRSGVVCRRKEERSRKWVGTKPYIDGGGTPSPSEHRPAGHEI
jgi:hypothetical protein